MESLVAHAEQQQAQVVVEDFLLLIGKLDEFIRKYYKNKILKGILLFLIFSISYLSVLSIIEYFAQFSITVRSVIFFTSLVLVLFLFYDF